MAPREPSALLPRELSELVEATHVPPALRAACEQEWAELLRSQREVWRRQQYADEYPEEPQLSLAQHEIDLQRVLSALEDEEARWRTGAAANERRWVELAEEMFTRWRLEDATQIDEQQQRARDEAARHEIELAELRPAPCRGWARLLEASQLGRVGARRVAELCANGSCAGSSASHAALSLSAAHAPAPAALLDEESLRRLLSMLRRAGGAPLDDEPLCTAICSALAAETEGIANRGGGDSGGGGGAAAVSSGGASGGARSGCGSGGDKSGGGGSGRSGHGGMCDRGCGDSDAASNAANDDVLPYTAVLFFLLALVDGSSATERLGLLLASLLPHRCNGGGHEITSVAPLTLAEQRFVYSELLCAAHAALAAATSLARSMVSDMPTPSEAAKPTAVSYIAAPAADDAAQAPPESAMQMQPMRGPDPAGLNAGPPPRDQRRTVDTALEQRPATWAICPPDARAFAIWCATSERATIGAALVSCREPDGASLQHTTVDAT